jgi:hypothetical protein
MSGTHSPGPWAVVEILQPELSFTVTVNDGSFEVADVWGKSDARLIAAAPDMLTALRMVEKRLAELNNSPTALSFARAAIAKAEGRS